VALGVSPHSIPAGVQLPQMPIVVNLPAIPSEETPAPLQATEEIPITKAGNTVDMNMNNIVKAFQTWNFQLSKANEAGYGC